MSSVPRGAFLLLPLLAAGCGLGPRPDQPPAIAYGSDICSHCRMIISEERHAAAARATDGVEERFDDPGCLARFLAADTSRQWRAWGHDERSLWHPVEDLWWLRGESFVTPMGSGLAGFSTHDLALAAADPQTPGPARWGEIDHTTGSGTPDPENGAP